MEEAWLLPPGRSGGSGALHTLIHVRGMIIRRVTPAAILSHSGRSILKHPHKTSTVISNRLKILAKVENKSVSERDGRKAGS